MTKIELYKCDDCGRRIEVAIAPGRLHHWLVRRYDEPPMIIHLCTECYWKKMGEWKEAKHVLADGGPTAPDDNVLLTQAAYEFIGRYVRKEGKFK